jgi:hypothetical protein
VNRVPDALQPSAIRIPRGGTRDPPAPAAHPPQRGGPGRRARAGGVVLRRRHGGRQDLPPAPEAPGPAVVPRACVAGNGGRPAQPRSPRDHPCQEHRHGHEIDVVVSTAPAFEPERVLAIGEAKATTKPIDVAELARLDHLRQLLPTQRVTQPPRLLLFARTGFSTRLRQTANTRPDIELVDLDRLYRGS